jgi:hypothetical protein
MSTKFCFENMKIWESRRRRQDNIKMHLKKQDFRCGLNSTDSSGYQFLKKDFTA